LLDAQFGVISSEVDVGPMHGDPEIPRLVNWTTGITSQSSGYITRNAVDSLQLRTSLTGLLSGASGDHELKGGIEIRDMRADVAWRQTGNVFLTAMTYDPTGVLPGYGHFDEDGDGLTDALALFMDPEAGAPVTSTGTAWGVFLQDEWRPTPRLTIKPGIRYDAVKYVNDGTRNIASLESFQPRLGVAWDMTGRGRHVLRANIGRFMHPAALSISLVADGRRFGIGEFYGYELWCSAGYCDHAFLENLFGPPIVRVDDEGDEHLYYPDDTFWTTPFESIESRGRSLQIFANYTLSVSKGSTEATADYAFSTLEYDLFPRDFLNVYGYLSDDRRHRLKVYGYVLLPWNMNIGFDARWASAPALNRTIGCDRIIGAPSARLDELGITYRYYYDVCGASYAGDVLFEPRGSRRGHSNYQLDLQVSQGFRLGGVFLQGFLTVLNVFSSEQPVEYETGELEVLPWGTPLDYQLPRRYEIGFRLEF